MNNSEYFTHQPAFNTTLTLPLPHIAGEMTSEPTSFLVRWLIMPRNQTGWTVDREYFGITGTWSLTIHINANNVHVLKFVFKFVARVDYDSISTTKISLFMVDLNVHAWRCYSWACDILLRNNYPTLSPLPYYDLFITARSASYHRVTKGHWEP